MATAETEGIDKQSKLLLNKITPDNYESIKTQICSIYKSATTEDAKKIFVQVFFLKACHEEKYTILYIELIKAITKEVFKMEHGGHLTKDYSLMKSDFVIRIQKEC